MDMQRATLLAASLPNELEFGKPVRLYDEPENLLESLNPFAPAAATAIKEEKALRFWDGDVNAITRLIKPADIVISF
jgi:hypothetical protein